jgi:chorismate mutase
MHVRGIRGATTAETNTREAIIGATKEMLAEIVRANGIDPSEIAAVFFAATRDLNAAYPSEAARQLGWNTVPLLAFADLDVPGSVSKCLRVLLLWNTMRRQEEIVHIYLRGAVGLRPDLSTGPTP